ncbi:polysaccharide deacetylase family protein [Pseudalkalibacillus decolorationis]|uniref:polysaccharide deacetylase family protein n=1 Tax=Pseudalkalibacillus decolorationis TaxID=163879 RepID=UPI00214720F4|nr:polysaccharide deacetylase family protein [Pseudalkalibacillus decolorationis]
MRRYLHPFLFIILLLLTYSSIQNPLSVQYIQSLKEHSRPVVANTDESKTLTEKVNEYAANHNQKPVNARIDPVWKAIPGYNGLIVNKEASLKRMKKEGKFDKSKVVYKQTFPEVSLEELPPAPIYRGNPNKPMVAFLINVAWGTEFIPGMLETLKNENVHVTFFLDGSWVKKNQEMATVIMEEGHEIGNHAYTHPDMKTLTNNRVREELSKTNEVIKSTLDVTPDWFAPPSGSYRNDVVNIAAAMKMKTILWSLDTVDWKKPDPSQMANRIINDVHPGAMILMHPTSSTEKGLEQMIKGIKDKGYQIGTVSQLMSEKRIIDAGMR